MCLCVFALTGTGLSVCVDVCSQPSAYVYPRLQSMTDCQLSTRVRRRSWTRKHNMDPVRLSVGEVIRSEGEQVVATHFSLPPSSPPSKWQGSEVGPGKGCWLRRRDIPAFLCRPNRSQHSLLSLEINGPQCYLNTRWPQREGGSVTTAALLAIDTPPQY